MRTYMNLQLLVEAVFAFLQFLDASWLRSA
jgi:hypothetical protein